MPRPSLISWVGEGEDESGTGMSSRPRHKRLAGGGQTVAPTLSFVREPPEVSVEEVVVRRRLLLPSLSAGLVGCCAQPGVDSDGSSTRRGVEGTSMTERRDGGVEVTW